MRVRDICARIVELSHQGDNDSELLTRALGWLNSAYFELMNELVLIAPDVINALENSIVTLQMDDDEQAMKLPVAYVGGLIWGGLVWSALFESNFVSSSELAVYQRQWQQHKEAVKLALFGKRERLYVKPYVLA